MSAANGEYTKGYNAGKRFYARELAQLKEEVKVLRGDRSQSRRERVYLHNLETVLKHCGGWRIEGERIHNADGYCRLAKIFTDAAIKEMGGE